MGTDCCFVSTLFWVMSALKTPPIWVSKTFDEVDINRRHTHRGTSKHTHTHKHTYKHVKELPDFIGADAARIIYGKFREAFLGRQAQHALRVGCCSYLWIAKGK